ncbi:hypothetical protein ACIBG8_05435 [Nonomuraea sp. NPDC050556]|uniref:hypothetical protein n=1 Tax=Nonomuraea sp. NPDC050556 TaxID=3364369 RepID=UPI0037BB8CB2
MLRSGIVGALRLGAALGQSVSVSASALLAPGLGDLGPRGTDLGQRRRHGVGQVIECQ